MIPEVGPDMPSGGADGPLNPSAVPVEQLARLLGLPIDDLRRHVADGAPTNANGTVHLVHYAAWLNSPRRGNDGRQDGGE